jgi:hypothetical protein
VDRTPKALMLPVHPLATPAGPMAAREIKLKKFRARKQVLPPRKTECAALTLSSPKRDWPAPPDIASQGNVGCQG